MGAFLHYHSTCNKNLLGPALTFILTFIMAETIKLNFTRVKILLQV